MESVLFIRHDSQVIMPKKGSAGAACFDLYSFSMSDDDRGYTVDTGLSIALPPGHALLIYPRSGLATKLGLTLRNGVGIVDEDYRGRIKIMFNHVSSSNWSEACESLQYGNRVAQAMVIKLPEITWKEVDVLPSSVRGEGGFGSTGVK